MPSTKQTMIEVQGNPAEANRPGRGLGLPPRYRLVRELAANLDSRVELAEIAGERVVVRIEASHGAPRRSAELAVLAAMDHPGLAKLVEFGTTSNGERFVARRWVEGVDFAQWSRGRSPEEIGAVIARLAPALEHLHQRGFIHADLKAANVVVGPDDRPVLTDFGLSVSREDSKTGASGSWYAIAPEALLGARIDARADLFALGAMLATLLATPKFAPREFYARFPSVSFFEAAGIAPEDLPVWARDLAANLLSRDPRERPSSALAVGRALAARLHVDLGVVEAQDAPRWTPRTGREPLFAALVASRENVWLRLPLGELSKPFAAELALALALAGERERTFELESELATVLDTQALDRWALGVARSCSGERLVVAVEGARAWPIRAVEALTRALLQVESKSAIAVIAPADAPTPAHDLPGSRISVRGLVAAELAAGFATLFESESSERRTAFAELLERESRGSATRVDELLRSAVRRGWVLAADLGWRLRPGALPTVVDGDALRQVPGELTDRRVLAALAVLEPRATLDQVARLTEIARHELDPAIARLARDGSLRAQGETLELLPGGRVARESLVDAATWRELHARCAEQLRRVGARRSELVLHEVASGNAEFEALIDHSRELRDDGLNELALELGERAEAFGLVVDRSALVAERAFAWCGLGELERALPLARELELGGGAKERALAELVRARASLFRHDSTAALAAARRAAALDASHADEAAAIEVRALFELRSDRALVERVAALRAEGGAKLGERARSALAELEALALSRLGELDRAQALLQSELERSSAHAQRRAALSIDLASIDRRRGDREAASRRYQEALEGYERAGFLPGAAQARALLGAVLRESGELVAAEELLLAAQESRERLGDRSGAVSARGMLGLVHADRGRVRAAIEELERAAADLAREGKSIDAALLSARASEAASRIGVRSKELDRPDGERNLIDGDPRILISRGRALDMLGDREAARASLARAHSLARSLKLGAVSDEAEGLLARLDGRPRAAPNAAPHAAPEEALNESAALEDERLLALLASTGVDSAEGLAFAESLARRGRDDRAARLFFALAARVSDRTRAETLHRRARELFARCSAGLSAAEADALRTNLCSVPDPFPEDFAAEFQLTASEEDFEMEVVSLLEINRQLLEQEDLKRLLGTIVEKALEVSGAQRGFLVLEDHGELSFDTARDSRRGDVRDPDLEVSRSVLNEALERMQPLRVSNAAAEPDFASSPSVIALDLRSILCVPFPIDKHLRGVIYVDHRLVEGAFSPRAERMLSLLADQAGLAILQVRRMEEIRRLNRELRGQMVDQESELKTARKALADANLPTPSAGMVGSSEVMREAFRVIERAALARMPVLVTGESGTGKELAARALHSLSPRAEAPFISESCAALPPTLIESELFGTRRGAFTGADRDRVGLIERAHGGTLFLDEIGELPLELQAKLLRVLETSEVRRLGETESRRVDFRLVAATNRDLETEVREGRFRADLYFRLDGLRVRMPTLAERASDIPELVDHFLRVDAIEHGRKKNISSAVLARLARRAWPGNVRELFNELARLSVMSEGDIVDPNLVRDPSMVRERPVQPAGSVKTLAELEKEAIYHALEVAGGDKRKAANLLGISRAKVYQRLKEWGDTTGGDDESS